MINDLVYKSTTATIVWLKPVLTNDWTMEYLPENIGPLMTQ